MHFPIPPQSLTPKNPANFGLERGGHKSFNLEPFREHYLAQLGREEGQVNFKQLAALLGAMSPVSTDLSMLRSATYYDWLIKQGKALPQPSWDASTGRYVLPAPLPPPWGHFKQGLHAKKANEVFTQEGLDPLSDPKIASIAEQYRGNQNPIPFDRHVVRILDVTNPRGRQLDSLPRAGYGFTERLVQPRAWNMGLTPGQYQGALRAGGAEYTGLRSREPLLTTLAKRLKITADRDNIPILEALRRLIGEEGLPLASLGIVAGLGTAGSGRPEGVLEEYE